MTLILIACIIFQTSIAIYLFNLNPDDDFDPILKNFLILIAVHLSTKFFVLVILNNSFLYNKVGSGFGFAYGPLLYIIYHSFINKKLSRKKILLHLAPFFAASLLYIFIIAGLMFSFLSEKTVFTWVNIYQLFIVASLILYPLIILFELKKKQNLSYPKNTFKLLINICYILLASALSSEIVGFFIPTLLGSVSFDFRLVPYAFFAMIPICILRYKLINKDAKSFSIDNINLSEDKPEKRYEKSALNKIRLDEYEKLLKSFMDNSKIYLDSALSLDDLSDKIQIPKHHITQVLNENLKKNFYQFINEYRIREAQEKLKEEKQNSNLLALAYDCGFNSKSSFNAYFKKLTGFTPSDYKRQLYDNKILTIN